MRAAVNRIAIVTGAVLAVAAAPAPAATLGVDANTLRLDAAADTSPFEDLSVGFEPLSDGFFFSASAERTQPGSGCQVRSTSIVCSTAGISAVEIRGPRTATARIDLGLMIAREGTTPAVTGSIDAGARNDGIDTVNAIADTVSCGPGIDSARGDSRDTLQADCEETAGVDGRASKARLLPGSNVVPRASKKLGRGIETRPYGVDFSVTCPATAPDDSCGGKLDVFVAEPSYPGGRRFFGNATYAIARGATRPVKVSVGFGAVDGQTAASYRQQVAAIRAALKKRGRARMRAQVRSGSSRFQHRFSVTSLRR